MANLAFSWQAVVGARSRGLTVAITVENFTGAIGTVIFVGYLSALCRNPPHTATQYALLTALAAVGRTYLSAGRRLLAEASGWVTGSSSSARCRRSRACAAVVAAGQGHFKGLEKK